MALTLDSLTLKWSAMLLIDRPSALILRISMTLASVNFERSLSPLALVPCFTASSLFV